MKKTALYRPIACLLAAAICFAGLPLTARVSAAGLDIDVEPSFMLNEDTHHLVTEIPIGKAFAISVWVGDPDDLRTVSLVSADGAQEYVLYDNGAVNYNGYIADPDEGPGWMRGFLSAGFRPGDYYTKIVTASGEGVSETTVTFINDGSYVTPPVLTTRELPDAKEGGKYSFTLKAKPAYDGKITWSIASGDFPAGLKLDPSTGTISGTPTTSGVYVFSVTMEEQNGGSQTDQLFLTVEGDVRYVVRPEKNGVRLRRLAGGCRLPRRRFRRHKRSYRLYRSVRRPGPHEGDAARGLCRGRRLPLAGGR